MGTDLATDAAHLCDQARQGAARALADLDGAVRDLAQPWPRVAPEVIEEGRVVVGRAASALRTVIERLGGSPSPGINDQDDD